VCRYGGGVTVPLPPPATLTIPRPRATTTNGGTVNQNPPGLRPATVPTVATVGGNRTAARGAVWWRRPHAFCGIKTPAARKERAAGGRGVVYGAAAVRGVQWAGGGRARRVHILLLYTYSVVSSAVGARAKKTPTKKTLPCLAATAVVAVVMVAAVVVAVARRRRQREVGTT